MLKNESYFTIPDFHPAASRHNTYMPNNSHNFADLIAGLQFHGIRLAQKIALQQSQYYLLECDRR